MSDAKKQNHRAGERAPTGPTPSAQPLSRRVFEYFAERSTTDIDDIISAYQRKLIGQLGAS